ncbi:MAG: hypothetical protein WCJ33_08035 [Pseudomonadota bacterium]
MSIEEQLVAEIKPYINKGNLDGLKEQLLEYYLETDFGCAIAWDYIFQKVYLHAALKKQKLICEWLDTVFTEFDTIQQIALRQMFSYARYLLNK